MLSSLRCRCKFERKISASCPNLPRIQNMMLRLLLVGLAVLVGFAQASLEHLSADNFESSLSVFKVSLVEFFDSACHGCGKTDISSLNSALEQLKSVPSAGGGEGSDFGIFRFDVSESNANSAVGMKFGAVKGQSTLRVFRGENFARSYTSGISTKAVVDFLTAVRDGRPISLPSAERAAPDRSAASYAEATANLIAQQTKPSTKTAVASTQEWTTKADGTSEPSAQAQPSVTNSKSASFRNYTVEAQQLIDADNPEFVPKDPRHLGIYEYAAWHHHQVSLAAKYYACHRMASVGVVRSYLLSLALA